MKFNGIEFRRTNGTDFRVTPQGVEFFRASTGQTIPVDLAGTNYGYTPEGRVYLAKDGEVWTAPPKAARGALDEESLSSDEKLAAEIAALEGESSEIGRQQTDLGNRQRKIQERLGKLRDELVLTRFGKDPDLWNPDTFAAFTKIAPASMYGYQVLATWTQREFDCRSGGWQSNGSKVYGIPVLDPRPSKVEKSQILRYNKLVRDAKLLPDDEPLLLNFMTDDLSESGVPQMRINKDGTATFLVMRWHHEYPEVEDGDFDLAWAAALQYEANHQRRDYDDDEY